jgi:hypothetical protein
MELNAEGVGHWGGSSVGCAVQKRGKRTPQNAQQLHWSVDLGMSHGSEGMMTPGSLGTLTTSAAYER